VLPRKLLDKISDVAKLLGHEIVQYALLRVDRKLCSVTCTTSGIREWSQGGVARRSDTNKSKRSFFLEGRGRLRAIVKAGRVVGRKNALIGSIHLSQTTKEATARARASWHSAPPRQRAKRAAAKRSALPCHTCARGEHGERQARRASTESVRPGRVVLEVRGARTGIACGRSTRVSRPCDARDCNCALLPRRTIVTVDSALSLLRRTVGEASVLVCCAICVASRIRTTYFRSTENGQEGILSIFCT
jgi:hypothetical protein